MQRKIVCNESVQGSLWITPRPRPPHPPGPFIWWRVMVGPGQHRAGECCLTEDNYQLCIITCVAGHRGHARAGNWEQRGLLKHDHERAIWWMSWRIQQVYNKNTICVKISTTKIDHLCMYNLPSTIHHSSASFPGLCRSGGRLAGSRGETWPRTLPRLR